MFNPESGPREEKNPQQVEAEKLQGELQKKSFVEKHFAEVQTREAPIRGAENPELVRGGTFRFERGQILKAYKILREQIRDAQVSGEDATEGKNLLKEIRGRAKILEKNLDTLEKQYYENIKTVDVDTEFGKFSVPVVELDLRDPKETEKDERTPYFFITGMPAGSFHRAAAITMALALQGHKVYAPAEIEQPFVKKPDNYKDMLKERGDFKIQADVFKQIVRNLGLDKVNVMGHSLGATMALELGADKDFEELQDLVVMEPLGMEDKGVAKLAMQFGIGQGMLRQMPFSESRIKATNEGVGTESHGDNSLYYEDIKIMAKQIYGPEKLSQIKPSGRFQVWFGTDSPVINTKKMEETLQQAAELRGKSQDASQLEVYEIVGGEHMWLHKNVFSILDIMNGPKPKEQITRVDKSDLNNSAIERILKDIK